MFASKIEVLWKETGNHDVSLVTLPESGIQTFMQLHIIDLVIPKKERHL